MAFAVTLSQKDLGFLIEALEARIETIVATYQTTPPSEDAAGDFGNDLHHLRQQLQGLKALRAQGPGTAHDYECWADPEDQSLTLLRSTKVAELRANQQLSSSATLLYRFSAHTGEEAMAIRNLRQGWAPYVPMGDAAPCPTCGTSYYPSGYGDCWRCGHIG